MTKKTKLTRTLTAAVSVVALSAVMYGCSSGHSDADLNAAKAKAMMEAAAQAEKEKQAAAEQAAEAKKNRLAQIEAARQAVAAAATAEAAQAAKDAVNAVATVAEGAELQGLVEARKAALMTAANADAQKMALTDAAGMVDTSDLMTAEDIAAANAAIAALKAALATAADVSDADKAMYQGQLDAAETAVMTAQSALDHAAQTMALSDAVDALRAIDLSALSDEDAIAEANTAIAALRMALGAATELSDADKAVAMTELATANRSVMAAQGRVDTEGQKMMLSDAVDALGAIDLDDLMTQEQIDAADAAIIALDLALDAATSLTDAQKLDATVDVTLAKRKVMAAKDMLATNIGDQRMALTEAGTALGEIDLDDLDTPEKIAAANEAVEALKMALDGATHISETAKAMYQTQLDTATETVRVAQTGMDLDERMMAQKTAIETAVTMARTAVAGVNDKSTDSEVAAADTAVKAVENVITAADDLSEDDAAIISAKAVLGVIKPQLAAKKTSRTAAMAKAVKAQGVATAKTGKAMHAALGGPATGDTALDNNTANTPTLAAAGLSVDAAAGAGAFPATGDGSDPVLVVLKAGDSAGALGSWNGMNYAHTNTGTKVVNEARVYNNKGPGKRVSFADEGYSVHTGDTGDDDIKGYLTLDEADSATLGRIMGATFTHSGTSSHAIPENNVALKVRGTYDGAPGEYRCTGVCSSTNDGEGSPSALGGVWHFKPDAGAMVHQPDDAYLYYGWWVSKGKDGMPTAASAFTSKMGVFNDDGSGGETALTRLPQLGTRFG